jgi:PKD repeat protein
VKNDFRVTRRVCILALVAAPLLVGGCGIMPHGGQAPHAVLDASQETGTAPLVVSFDASRSCDDGQVVAYEWDFGDGTPSGNGPRCTHSFTTPGARDVVLTVIDDEGLVGRAEVVVVVENLLPVANLRMSDDAPDINEWVTVDGSGSFDPDGSDIECVWNFGDGASAVGVRSGHAYSAAGTYTIVLSVRDASGGESVIRHTVLVHRATPGGGCSGGGAVCMRR